MAWDDFDPQKVSHEFWSRGGFRQPNPTRFEETVALSLPVAIVHLPILSISRIRSWLDATGATCQLETIDRQLQGCLIAQRGHGLIFVDRSQPTNEVRFTTAHEVAHFLYHYLVPRERALLAMGNSILPVLDGERKPTAAEKLSGVFQGIRLGTYQHTLDRDRGEAHSTQIGVLESEADFIAMELLAPIAQVIRYSSPGADCEQKLIQHFGLPDWAARTWSVRVDARRHKNGFIAALKELSKTNKK